MSESQPPDQKMEFLKMWPVYFDPSDYPGLYVARLFVGEHATQSVIVSEDYRIIESHMLSMWLVKLQPSDDDDPKIKEIWL